LRDFTVYNLIRYLLFLGNDVVTLELFTARMSTYKSMSSSMYRWRDMYLPPEPTKQEDILLNHSFSKIGDESIILGDTITQGILFMAVYFIII
jgi:hypothetical protein